MIYSHSLPYLYSLNGKYQTTKNNMRDQNLFAQSAGAVE